jgi:hypothetical protein
MGVAGYYGANDNHTHYRFVSTEVVATPGLVNLNGHDPRTNAVIPRSGGVGVQLCDPSTGKAAQMSLSYNGTKNGYQLLYAVGFFGPGSTAFGQDPCVQTGFIQFPFPGKSAFFGGITAGDTIYLAIYYDPNGGRFHHQISFGACDITQKVCANVWSGTVFSQSFTEFGTGAFSDNNRIQGDVSLLNKVSPFTNNQVTCYSCAGPVNITTVQPVNSFGIGGLYEAQFVNVSGQIQMSPMDSLTNAGFTIYSGSTGSR